MEKPKSRDLAVFLVFFVIVFFYWYLVNMGEEHETKFTFDIVLRHVPDDVIVTDIPAEKMTLTLRDKGEKILGYRTRRTFRQLTVDCRDYRPVNGHVVITGTALNELLEGNLSSSAQILSLSPDTIQYYLASSTGKRLPVHLMGSVSTDNSHVIGSQTLTPDSITVFAPQALLDTLSCIFTEPVSLEGLDDSVTVDLAFVMPQRGIRFEPESTQLDVKVTPYVQKSFELPIGAWLMPYKSVLKTFPSKATVTFQVSMEHFYDVTEDQFELAVNYLNLQPDDGGKARLELVRQPEGIRSVSITPVEVDYLIENSGDLIESKIGDLNNTNGNGI